MNDNARKGNQSGVKELFLAYQPVMDISFSTPIVAAYECLLRVIDGNRPGTSPVELIEQAEDNGSIKTIDYWVTDKACADLRANPSMRVWINLSQATLSSYESVKRIADLISIREVTHQMRIEMTETADGCSDSLINSLSLLKHMSIGVVLDDIQDGYSKAHLLQTDLIAGCKLSRQSTQRIAESENAFLEAKKLVDWCKANKKSVVMEGIENLFELELAKRLGVNYCQGYYFWPALNISELPKMGSKALPTTSPIESVQQRPILSGRA